MMLENDPERPDKSGEELLLNTIRKRMSIDIKVDINLLSVFGPVQADNLSLPITGALLRMVQKEVEDGMRPFVFRRASMSLQDLDNVKTFMEDNQLGWEELKNEFEAVKEQLDVNQMMVEDMLPSMENLEKEETLLAFKHLIDPEEPAPFLMDPLTFNKVGETIIAPSDEELKKFGGL